MACVDRWRKEGEGVGLKDPRTLSRANLTVDIISRLEETHVVLVKSPPMTGKTSLAALVGQALVDRHIIDNNGMYLFSFSALSKDKDDTFEENFKKQCKIGWKEAVSTFPTKSNCEVYLVVGEAQATYSEGISSPRKSAALWNLVKYVVSNEDYNIRILMFGAHGSGVEYTRHSTLIQLNDRIMLGIAQLNFSHVEVSEYVENWFKGIMCFEGSSSAMEEFCATLEEVTGGRVGLCATAIDERNRVYAPVIGVRVVNHCQPSGSACCKRDHCIEPKITRCLKR